MNASFLSCRFGLFQDLLLRSRWSHLSRLEDIFRKVVAIAGISNSSTNAWGREQVTHLRTCVILRSFMPGWYCGHEVQVLLNMCVSVEISSDLAAPSRVSCIMVSCRNAYLELKA